MLNSKQIKFLLNHLAKRQNKNNNNNNGGITVINYVFIIFIIKTMFVQCNPHAAQLMSQ